MTRCIITLLTDFGLEDGYVGMMKGVILSIHPLVQIVDITHGIAPQDILQAAGSIHSAWRYFPKGSIHVVVVDPGVGGNRKMLCLQAGGHFFLAPDNGVLSRVLESEPVQSLNLIENPRYFFEPVSRTFHGRDIFAPVAAHLSTGLSPEEIGPSFPPENAVCLPIPRPCLEKSGGVIGQVLSVDRFGNLITNIDAQWIRKIGKPGKTSRIGVRIGDFAVSGLSKSYQDVSEKTLLALINSGGYLEIAVNRGNAAEFCRASPGGKVWVHVEQEPRK